MLPPMSSPSSSAAALAATALALAGCAFRPGGGPGDDAGGDDDIVDAAGRDGAAVDAPRPVTVDASPDAGRPPFDTATCPSSYVDVFNTSSRWRMIAPLPWAAAAAACKGHAAGLTHLAVFSNSGERDAVGTALLVSADFRRTWIGVWHDGTAVRTVTGEAVYPDTLLRPTQAVSWIRDLLTPFRADPTSTSFAALCECDGLPSSP